MTNQETKAGNVLIAYSPFSGKDVETNIEHYADSGNEIGLKLYLDGLKYHSDWNSLMGVVEKIEEIGFDVKISTNYTSISNYNPIVQEFGGKKIEVVFQAVVKYIEWHNA